MNSIIYPPYNVLSDNNSLQYVVMINTTLLHVYVDVDVDITFYIASN
jgi:hypothetical protein